MNRKPCNCPKCLSAVRQDDNVERARTTAVTVICVGCGQPDNATAGGVLAKRGRVLCGSCDRRKS